MMIYDQGIDLKSSNYVRHSIYRNVANYFNKDGELLSFVNNRISPGPKRIWLDKDYDFLENTSLLPQEISVSALKCFLSDGSEAKNFRNQLSTTKLSPDESTRKIVKKLDSIISKYFELFKNDSEINALIIEMISEKLHDYLVNDKVKSLIDLLGFGPGLTPLGDDIILGVLLCRNHLAFDKELNSCIKTECVKKTLPISGCFLKSACDCEFSDDFFELVNDVFIKNEVKENTIQRILKYGSSSGYGILYGFSEQFKQFLK